MKLILVIALTAYFFVESEGNQNSLGIMDEVEITDRKGKQSRKHQIHYSFILYIILYSC